MYQANLYVGSKEWAFTLLPPSLQEPGLDVLHIVYERMSIADVRTLIHEASLRPLEKEYRTFIINAQNLLGEAQNALLKLFEEPNEHTVFYLIIPREDILLPTLRSRLHVHAVENDTTVNTVFLEFQKLSYSERLQSIAKHLDAEDSAWVTAIVHGLSEYAHQSKRTALIEDVLRMESYIYQNGSAKKMLLEHVALSL